MTRRFELFSKLETPVLLDGEKICFIRTVKNCLIALRKMNGKKLKASIIYMSLDICPTYVPTMKEL